MWFLMVNVSGYSRDVYLPQIEFDKRMNPHPFNFLHLWIGRFLISSPEIYFSFQSHFLTPSIGFERPKRLFEIRTWTWLLFLFQVGSIAWMTVHPFGTACLHAFAGTFANENPIPLVTVITCLLWKESGSHQNCWLRAKIA